MVKIVKCNCKGSKNKLHLVVGDIKLHLSMKEGNKLLNDLNKIHKNDKPIRKAKIETNDKSNVNRIKEEIRESLNVIYGERNKISNIQGELLDLIDHSDRLLDAINRSIDELSTL